MGTPCVRIDCLAPPNPACSHVLGLDGCPECDGVRVPDWWKPCLRSPGCWLSSKATSVPPTPSPAVTSTTTSPVPKATSDPPTPAPAAYSTTTLTLSNPSPLTWSPAPPQQQIP